LLEIMVAIAVLSLTLVVLLGIVTTNVRATNHAKMNTAATFLARSKMIDIEDDILYNGFSSDSESDSGTFRDMDRPEFRWETEIERIELPSDLAQKTKDQATDKTQESDSTNPMSLLTGLMGSMMSAFIDPIRIGLEESVRKVTVRVLWNEIARPEQSMEVVQYLTDPAKLLTSGGMPGAPGTGGAPGGTKPPGLQPPGLQPPGLQPPGFQPPGLPGGNPFQFKLPGQQ
jgi:general secretion pathway protein I